MLPYSREVESRQTQINMRFQSESQRLSLSQRLPLAFGTPTVHQEVSDSGLSQAGTGNTEGINKKVLILGDFSHLFETIINLASPFLGDAKFLVKNSRYRS